MNKSRQLSILIVDDDFSFNEDISCYLEEYGGFKITNAYNAEDFKQKASDVDIIILDIRLPDRAGAQINTWSGLIALYQLQTDASKQCPESLDRVIIRSGHEESEAKKAGIKIPRYSCWLKTYAPMQEIIDALDRLISQVKNKGELN